jgi:hypothetical protein
MAKTPGVIIEDPAVTERQRSDTGRMWQVFFTVDSCELLREGCEEDGLRALQFLGFSRLEGRS